jgi:hypothetical protein
MVKLGFDTSPDIAEAIMLHVVEVNRNHQPMERGAMTSREDFCADIESWSEILGSRRDSQEKLPINTDPGSTEPFFTRCPNPNHKVDPSLTLPKRCTRRKKHQKRCP